MPDSARHGRGTRNRWHGEAAKTVTVDAEQPFRLTHACQSRACKLFRLFPLPQAVALNQICCLICHSQKPRVARVIKSSSSIFLCTQKSFHQREKKKKNRSVRSPVVLRFISAVNHTILIECIIVFFTLALKRLRDLFDWCAFLLFYCHAIENFCFISKSTIVAVDTEYFITKATENDMVPFNR